MIAPRVILTVHGGMTLAARSVARGMGKPCVAKRAGSYARRTAHDRSAGHEGSRRGRDHDRRWDVRVFTALPARCPQINERLETILHLADGQRAVNVRVTADNRKTPIGLASSGAEGIGLLPDGSHVLREERAAS